MPVLNVVVPAALVLKVVLVKLAELFPTPERMAEKMAAKREGMRKLKITLLESMTPSSFIFLLKRVCEKEEMKPTAKPMAVAAPGL